MLLSEPKDLSTDYKRVNSEWSEARRQFLKIKLRFQVLESLVIDNDFPTGELNFFVDSNPAVSQGNSEII